MHLITVFHNEESKRRLEEYELCFAANCAVFGGNVHIVAEKVAKPPSSMRCGGEWRCIDRHQRFSDLVELAREITKPGELCVIANGDMIISSAAQMQSLMHPNDAYCLARWDVYPEIQLCNYDYTQDVWAFIGPPRGDIGNYPIRHPGCDNKMTWDIRAAGYTVKNPSKTLKTYHVHYGDAYKRVKKLEYLRLPKPYLMIQPHHIDETPKYRELP